MIPMSVLGVLAIVAMGFGYGFKKSWLLWLAIPLWLALFIYISYYELWFPIAAQRSLLLLGIGGSIALGFAAIRMQIKPTNGQPNENNDDEIDDDDRKAQDEMDNWKKKHGYTLRTRKKTSLF